MANVLVVEDDRDIARALGLRLVSRGHQVDTAFDAVTATTIARRCHPKIAILDISMPGGDGFVVAERLQMLDAGLKLIFVTANSRPELREKAFAMGAAAFFEKPFVAEELMDAVASAA